MRGRTAGFALLLVAALVAAALAPASADDSLINQQHQLSDKISQTQDDLESASAKLQHAATDLARAQDQLPVARAALSSAVGRLGSSKARLELIRQQLRELQAQQDKVIAQIEQAQKRIRDSEILIARIASYQYQTGGFAELEVVLEAESPTDFVQRLIAAKSVTDSQAALIDQLSADRALLAARQQQMQVTQEAIQSTADEARAQVDRLRALAEKARSAKAQIQSLITLRANALSVARNQRAAEQHRLENLKSAQADLQAQIEQAASTGSGQPSGELLWPADGALIQGVGWRVHPVYGYRSCHTGIDIGAAAGAPIHAAADGVVIWTKAELDGPYGNNTLIDHGDGLSTFYAHQTSFLVSPGERVKKGETIGTVGSTGYATGPHLHFEVHINGEPYDPMGWFGGTKIPETQFCP